MALLIAPTLLNSFDWLNRCPSSWKERAYDSILSTLNREPFLMNEAIRKGQDFEKEVYRLANTDLDELDSSEMFKQVCRRVRGFEYQKSLKYFFKVDGIEYVCFGRTDCYSEKEIVDIKTTANFKGDNQYLNGWQHIFYPTMANVPDFTYLVVEWAEDGSMGAIHEVKHKMESLEENLKIIGEGIRNFIEYIEHDDKMKTAYYTKYNRRR